MGAHHRRDCDGLRNFDVPRPGNLSKNRWRLNIAVAYKTELKDQLQPLYDRLKQGFPALQLTRMRADQVDQAIIELWRQADVGTGFQLLAVGGYGRQELYPNSDIDLLILCDSDDQCAWSH